MKKTISLMLAIILLMATAMPISAAQADVVSPYYINTSTASVSLTISNTGKASWTLVCTGKTTATAIHSVTYLERLVGNTWVRVDLGNANDEYTYDVSTRYMVKSYTHNLTVRGTYRAVAVFTVYGTSQNETLTFYNQHVY